MTRVIMTWEFYYRNYNGNEVRYAVQVCKQPSRTKNWSELHDLLFDSDAMSIGFRKLKEA